MTLNPTIISQLEMLATTNGFTFHTDQPELTDIHGRELGPWAVLDLRTLSGEVENNLAKFSPEICLLFTENQVSAQATETFIRNLYKIEAIQLAPVLPLFKFGFRQLKGYKIRFTLFRSINPKTSYAI